MDNLDKIIVASLIGFSIATTGVVYNAIKLKDDVNEIAETTHRTSQLIHELQSNTNETRLTIDKSYQLLEDLYKIPKK
jgi:hypothetical protein